MSQKKRFLGIVGSYRKNGVIDTMVSEVLLSAARSGASTEKIYLSDSRIEFCTNCRECVQPTGIKRVPCVVHQHDDLNDIISKIERADTVVLGAPVNLGSANALTQRFAERCIGYYYYPWGAHYPVLRDKTKYRNAILISSSAAPGIMNSAAFGSGAMMTLRTIAELIGATIVEELKVGLVTNSDFKVPDKKLKKAREAGEKLAA